ncbi:hypothetical protein L1987_12411 [Smallanthus sonchifolius]|uniref:Uncharacterized protein n=1 Tax=Smallanthus sonchifolius TaxID=185202 RepID=A0ACB9JG15_9ASTR|nr:hypothetical protein L1987_12411 [Smallanthus sonchifolius]
MKKSQKLKNKGKDGGVNKRILQPNNVEYDVVEDEVVEERLVEDEVIDNDEVRDEVVANKENVEVVMDENVVENIPDDVVDCGNDDKEVKTIDDNKEGAANHNVNVSVGYTWPSLNRMGDERLLKELDNLKKKVAMGEKMTTTETLVTNYIFKDTDASK